MKDKWYVVEDLEGFTDSTRVLVFNNFGESLSGDEDYLFHQLTTEEYQELNTVLTQDESIRIVKDLVKKQIHKNTKDIRYVISDEIFMEIVTRLSDRLISNLIHSLVKKGLLETAYDTDANDFIFWVKKNETENIEKPETD